MSWQQIDDKHKKKYDRNFIACTEKYERQYVIDLVHEHFPSKAKSTIETAFDSTCRKVGGNHPRTQFLKELASQLNLPHP